MKSVLGCLALLAALAFSACNGRSKDDDDLIVDPPGQLDFSSQFFTDANGQPVGSTGTPEDYQQEAWESWVKELFTPLDTAALPAGIASANNVERVSLFPNPGNTNRAMYVLGMDTMNVKMVLVDRQRAAKWRNTVNLQSSSNSAFLALQIPSSAVAGDSLYRLYYAFSLAGSPYFHTSHADITVR